MAPKSDLKVVTAEKLLEMVKDIIIVLVKAPLFHLQAKEEYILAPVRLLFVVHWMALF